MAEIAIEKIIFPSLYKFLYRYGIFYVDTDRSHTHIALFVHIEKRCVIQRCFFSRSAVGGKGKHRKTVFVRYPKHWWYLCFSALYAQTFHKIQLPFLCFGVP